MLKLTLTLQWGAPFLASFARKPALSSSKGIPTRNPGSCHSEYAEGAGGTCCSPAALGHPHRKQVSLNTASPIFRPPAAVSNGPNNDPGILLRINNGKRKSPKQESSRIILSDRPTFRSFTDRMNRPIKLFDEVCRRFGTAPAIPGHRTLHIRRRALVVAEAASVHSALPTALDAILPMAQLRLCPPSNLAYGALLPRPKPPERIPLHLRDCRAECWPMPRAPQPEAPAPVSEDRKPLGSWRYSNPRLLSFRSAHP